MSNNLTESALKAVEMHYSVLPCNSDKTPAITTWKEYQSRPMTEDEIRSAFAYAEKMALICGRVSGNLECLDFDDHDAYEPFNELLELRCPGLPERLLARQTPSGEYHLIYRCDSPIGGNQQLACNEGGEVRIETRGEGGYFVTTPIPGYDALRGKFGECPLLTQEERQAIHQTARAFDLRDTKASSTQGAQPRDNTDSPGTRFNEAHTVADLLLAHGWQEGRRTTAGVGWTRPGKESGISGVKLEGSGNFYVWSSNAAPLETGRSYDAFGLYTMYNHDGDFTAAARSLRGSSSKVAGNEWPAPLPLPDELLPVAQFDFALLPETIRPWAMDICDRLQCPPDFVAAGFMTTLSSVIGLKVGIRPQASTDWTVVCNLWALIVGRPGVLKSPALEATLTPLKRLMTEAITEYEVASEGFQIDQTVSKLQMEAREKEARAMLKNDSSADITDLLRLGTPEEPTLKRYMVNDSTPAALGELLRQNQNGLLVYRDELVSLLKGLDREDQAEGRGFYLTAWNGDSSYTFDRIGRGMNLHIESVCLSILGGTQPGRLSEYIRDAVKGGSADDGLIQRFGLMVWPDINGAWKNVDRWPDTVAKNQAFKVFEYLNTLDLQAIGAIQDTAIDGEPDGIPYLRFSPVGLDLFTEWRTAMETRLRGGELFPALESHFAKYRSLLPSLALILHLSSGGTGPVSEDATLQALAWGEYLEI